MVKHKIRHEFTAPYSSHQVGGAERSWRTLFDMARCLLINSQLPKKLWNHAVRTLVLWFTNSTHLPYANTMFTTIPTFWFRRAAANSNSHRKKTILDDSYRDTKQVHSLMYTKHLQSYILNKNSLSTHILLTYRQPKPLPPTRTSSTTTTKPNLLFV